MGGLSGTEAQWADLWTGFTIYFPHLQIHQPSLPHPPALPPQALTAFQRGDVMAAASVSGLGLGVMPPGPPALLPGMAMLPGGGIAAIPGALGYSAAGACVLFAAASAGSGGNGPGRPYPVMSREACGLSSLTPS